MSSANYKDEVIITQPSNCLDTNDSLIPQAFYRIQCANPEGAESNGNHGNYQ